MKNLFILLFLFILLTNCSNVEDKYNYEGNIVIKKLNKETKEIKKESLDIKLEFEQTFFKEDFGHLQFDLFIYQGENTIKLEYGMSNSGDFPNFYKYTSQEEILLRDYFSTQEINQFESLLKNCLDAIWEIKKEKYGVNKLKEL